METVKELERKRSALARSIRQLQADLDVLDKTIAACRFKSNPLIPRFKKGHLGGPVTDVLRTAPEPMTTREITQHVTESRGVDIGDRALGHRMTQRVGLALR